MNQTSEDFELPDLHSWEGEKATDTNSHKTVCQVPEHTPGTWALQVCRREWQVILLVPEGRPTFLSCILFSIKYNILAENCKTLQAQLDGFLPV